MKKPTPPAKKTKSYSAYKRASFWQIVFPMIVVALIFVAASFMTASGGGESIGQWASISTIWLLIPVIIFLILNLVILAGGIYGMMKLLGITPIYTHRLTGFIRLVGEKIEELADAATKPIFKLEGFSASLRSIFRKK